MKRSITFSRVAVTRLLSLGSARPLLRLVALAALCSVGASCDRSSRSPSDPTVVMSDRELTSSMTRDPSEPSGDPPAAWVYDPAELGPEMPQSASNCDFTEYPFPATVQPYLHPNAVCRQKEWGNSGIIRQQGHDLHVTTLPKCNGGPGDITEIRLCKHGWENQPTTWGKAGPLGCVGVKVTPTCET